MLDVTNFQEEVLDSKLPVLVDFYADWCGPCKVLKPRLEELEKTYEGKVTFVTVNVGELAEVAAKYQIRGIPALMLYKDGQMHNVVSGLVSSDVIINKLESLL